jgi:hypothetical protein
VTIVRPCPNKQPAGRVLEETDREGREELEAMHVLRCLPAPAVTNGANFNRTGYGWVPCVYFVLRPWLRKQSHGYGYAAASPCDVRPDLKHV